MLLTGTSIPVPSDDDPVLDDVALDNVLAFEVRVLDADSPLARVDDLAADLVPPLGFRRGN